VVRLLVPVKGTLLAADYLNYLADVFMVDGTVIVTALERAKPLPAHRVAADGTLAGARGGGAASRVRSDTRGGVSTFAGGTTGAAGAKDDEVSEGSGQGLFDSAGGRGSVLDRTVVFERELLFLYVEHLELRQRLREAFGRIIWSDSRHEAIAEALLSFDVAEEPDATLSRLTARIPDASELLSGARLPEFSGVPPNRMAGMLMFNIKEGQLKRDIRSGNARLRRFGEEEDAARDELFRHIAELQQELTDLRKRYHAE
jgi:DNA primase